MVTTASLIEKEQVRNCVFTPTSKSLNQEQINIIHAKLYKAMILGNTCRTKVKIHFTTTEGLKIVDTTVWAYTENYILIKGGVFIPTESVIEVDGV
ncbi:MAG: hypothetical protein RMJ53_04880 [Chitinophagales bacterium]|nr:hypothetical protein [Chitinophagales bacterium]MDW8273547.1 hypothetical protein [Chitinophagales bacterium]